MPIANINGTTIYYEVRGKGDPIVFIGGLGTDTSLYTRIAPILATDFRVLIFDNRGSGQSGKPDIPYTIEMMAEDTAGLLGSLRISQAHVIGISMGGRIAIDLVLKHPEIVKSLILTSTGCRMKPLSPILKIGKFILEPILKKNPQPYYAFVRQLEASRTYDCSENLIRINVPTLILHGKKDRRVPFHVAKEMHNAITGSTLTAFDGGHLFFLRDFQKFTATVKDFLSKCSADNIQS